MTEPPSAHSFNVPKDEVVSNENGQLDTPRTDQSEALKLTRAQIRRAVDNDPAVNDEVKAFARFVERRGAKKPDS